MSIKLLQAVPGYQTELTDSFAADVSFPSLSLLSLPQCSLCLPLPLPLVGSEVFVSPLTVSGASSIWDQPEAMVFQ